jgi:hypothetical protein
MIAEEIPPLGHDGEMRLPAAENGRVLALADDLRAEDWPRPTDCPGWDFRAVLGHLLGMLELQADPEERARQIKPPPRSPREQGACGWTR